MKVLIVAADINGCFMPFIEEQISLLRRNSIDVIRYHITRKGYIGYLSELPHLKRLIRVEQPDIIHAHYGLSGLLANLQRRVPVVTTYHGSDINVPSIRRLSKLAMFLSRYNIFVSKSNIAIAKPRNHYTLLPCGVDLSVFMNRESSDFDNASMKNDCINVLFAGAFSDQVKDPVLAQQVIQMLATNKQKVNLIELKGYLRNEVAELMNSCHALLMTSKTEGSPQVIKEAMACGCPIVSVDVGDVAERVSGVEGCYVVATREPRDIAEALQKAISFKGKTNGRNKLIEMGLTNEQIIKQIIYLYKKILAN